MVSPISKPVAACRSTCACLRNLHTSSRCGHNVRFGPPLDFADEIPRIQPNRSRSAGAPGAARRFESRRQLVAGAAAAEEGGGCDAMALRPRPSCGRARHEDHPQRKIDAAVLLQARVGSEGSVQEYAFCRGFPMRRVHAKRHRSRATLHLRPHRPEPMKPCGRPRSRSFQPPPVTRPRHLGTAPGHPR